MAAKRGKKSADERPKDTTAVMFVALNINLLAFFIVLNSMAVLDEGHIKEALGSLLGSFGILGGGIRVETGETYFPQGPPFTSSIEEGAMALTDEIRRISDLYKKAAVRSGELTIPKDFDIVQKKGKVVITFAGDAAFVPGGAELRPEFTKFLRGVARIVRHLANPVLVEGHTDDLPIRTDAYTSSWALSTMRAVNVVRYFLEEERISMYRLSAVGYGETRPLYPNTSPENRARNRRMNIIIDMNQELEIPGETGDAVEKEKD